MAVLVRYIQHRIQIELIFIGVVHLFIALEKIITFDCIILIDLVAQTFLSVLHKNLIIFTDILL